MRCPRHIPTMLAALVLLAGQGLGPARAANDTVRVALTGGLHSLNPLFATTPAENDAAGAIFSGLVTLDQRGNAVPDLAQEVPSSANGGISADGRTLIYLLQPGPHWQDGVALTADDVAYTFYAMRDAGAGVTMGPGYANVASVQARDYETVVVQLKAPDQDAPSELFVNGLGGSILPRHVLGNVRDLRHAAFNEHPVGSGPYAVDGRLGGIVLRLHANHRYFQGVPPIEHLELVASPDSSATARRLASGTHSFARGLGLRTVQQLRAAPSLHVAAARTNELTMLIERVDDPDLGDPRTRRALGRAIDRAAVVRAAYLGFASPANELEPPWSRWSTARATHPADLKAAGALLDAAGWRSGSGRYRTRDGKPFALTLTYESDLPEIVRTATLVRAQWTALGADVSLRAAKRADLFAAGGILGRGDFSAALASQDLGPLPGRDALIASDQTPPAGGNVARYHNDAVDQAIVTAKFSPVAALRKRAFATIAANVAADAPYVPIVWREDVYAADKRLGGVAPVPAGSDLWNVYAWTLR
jgi:peptide/nickel transport system substrate-binding protein